MKVGDKVRIESCFECPMVVGKVVTISAMLSGGTGGAKAVVNFGRGRPQKNRPSAFDIAHLSSVEGN